MKGGNRVCGQRRRTSDLESRGSMNSSALSGKIAVVTGAGSGIGREIARRMVELDAEAVILCDMNGSEKEAAADMGARAHPYRLDVTDEDAVTELGGYLEREFGRLDVLANNAGISGPKKRIHDYSLRR